MTEEERSDALLAEQGELPDYKEIIERETDYTLAEQNLIDRLRGDGPPERGKQHPDPDEAPPEHEFHREFNTEPKEQ